MELVHVEAEPPGSDRWAGPEGNLHVAVPTGVPREGSVVPGFASHVAQGGDLKVHGEKAAYALIHVEGVRSVTGEAGNGQFRVENKVKVLDDVAWPGWSLVAYAGAPAVRRFTLMPGEFANVVASSVDGDTALIVGMKKVPMEHAEIFQRKVAACREWLGRAKVSSRQEVDRIAEFEAETCGALPKRRFRTRDPAETG